MLKIKHIKRRKKISLNLSDLNLKHYRFVGLKSFHSSTCISQVFLNKQVILDINDWVNLSLGSEPVAETGGFLLGYSGELGNDNEYVIAIDYFIPDEVYMVEF